MSALTVVLALSIAVSLASIVITIQNRRLMRRIDEVRRETFVILSEIPKVRDDATYTYYNPPATSTSELPRLLRRHAP